MRKSSGCLGILLVLLLAVSLVVNVILFIANKMKGRGVSGPVTFDEDYVSGAASASDKIVLIDLRGLIDSAGSGDYGADLVDDIRLQVEQAARDRDVKGVVLRIDSPGGEVTASDEIYHYISSLRDGGKPVTVYMESIAASGGYYSALGGTYLMANPLSLTGSIGVILETFNVGDLLGKIGVRALVIKSGKMKDLLSPFRPATPEELAYVQGLINETYSRFVGLVAKERKLDEAKLRAGIADGRVLSGAQAKDAGLVDGLGYFEDAVKKEQELCKLQKARLVQYVPPVNYGRLVKGLLASPIGHLKVELPGAATPAALPLRSGKFYYLPASAVGY
ncbi:MAG: signal peptide peptidase SppA [Verrucomicrobium sp.]|nr:signal peptide peptidase SppA [Verrucomicrobium sp.]